MFRSLLVVAEGHHGHIARRLSHAVDLLNRPSAISSLRKHLSVTISSRLGSFSILAIPVLASTTPTVAGAGSPGEAPTLTTPAAIASRPHPISLPETDGIVPQNLNIVIGLGCSPITAAGVGSGSECNNETESCSDGVFGSVGISCAPITA
ncbi:uncharacterized protein PHACADRAFT_199292 [Phanerochaete carnosa HHB-10118-sp]|uniref:Hydrophobin n=1 Tax=Phanerochaete carnosa (strain HHB-10118-sp) TaxID=650164 RepID=K5VYC8_PHACS|nr:uncharacterized protein PHACADRAFT_199292 [Phanerochaete carnosa HHB-10118-sp]EKM51790.1 hypothetical protein PHACADRAFT_199292 [Phanerochaete carnosa HHB-10118-sp]